MSELQPIYMIGTFASFQVIGCITSIASVIYILKTFNLSKAIYLLALLDSVVSFIGFLILYVSTMANGLITESDPLHIQGKFFLF